MSDNATPKKDDKPPTKTMKERAEDNRKSKKNAATKKKEDAEKETARLVKVLDDLANVWTSAMVIEMLLLSASLTWALSGTLSLLFFMLLFNTRSLRPTDSNVIVQQNCVFNGVLWIVYGASSLPVLLALPFAWSADATFNFTIFLVIVGLVRGAVAWVGLTLTNEFARANLDDARASQARFEQLQKDDLQRAKAKHGRVETRF